MEISTHSRAEGHAVQLDEFRRLVKLEEDAHIEIRGASLVLVATGQTSTGRSVAWVEPSGDVVSAFVAAIADVYGNRLSQIVADEIGLRPGEGRPLSSRTVMQALTMAETVSLVLDGVRFSESLLRRSAAMEDVPQTDREDSASG